ncbi:hypothetical protein JQS43_02015 [Natronosporangium hydrolyticum]|uniref:Uncharacterized protein n=1 Tax=Natronosporangium hydrolyticum TaxID=2811111 RepID=A0A895YGF0_9ACTN|nr:hypothetical protein [Natronosporangium hydrolyticum]QSB15172.1 hypothetical protein JQS43_02015 [Natronosporangium hydrolyticum]
MSTVLDAARVPVQGEAESGAVVAQLVWRALRDPRGFSDAGAELEVSGVRPNEVAGVLPLLDNVRVEDWVGDSGTCYRDYVGQLPCGLLLRLITHVGLTADVCGGGR